MGGGGRCRWAAVLRCRWHSRKAGEPLPFPSPMHSSKRVHTSGARRLCSSPACMETQPHRGDPHTCSSPPQCWAASPHDWASRRYLSCTHAPAAGIAACNEEAALNTAMQPAHRSGLIGGCVAYWRLRQHGLQASGATRRSATSCGWATRTHPRSAPALCRSVCQARPPTHAFGARGRGPRRLCPDLQHKKRKTRCQGPTFDLDSWSDCRCCPCTTHTRNGELAACCPSQTRKPQNPDDYPATRPHTTGPSRQQPVHETHRSLPARTATAPCASRWARIRGRWVRAAGFR